MPNRSIRGRIAMVLVPMMLFVLVPAVGGAQSDQNMDLFSPLYQLYRYIRDDFYEPERIRDDEALYGAMRGIVRQLQDPYSEFLDPEDYEHFKQNQAGEFSGVGIEPAIVDGVLTVIRALVGAPAEMAGVLAGDQILAIDGEATHGMTLTETHHRLRGDIGTEVVLTMRHESGEIVDVPIIQDAITIPAAEGSLVHDGRIAYVRVYRFGTDTTRELSKALRTFDLGSLDGLILDLRDNGGGRMLEAMNVASCFVDSGFVLITAERLRAARKHYSFGNALPNLPLAILINRWTASASEVAAGAIRDNDMGVLIGEPSFGKGVYQRVFEFPDGSALKLTVGKTFTPDGYAINGVGLNPDILVEEGEDAIEVAIAWLNAHEGQLMPIDLDARYPRPDPDSAP